MTDDFEDAFPDASVSSKRQRRRRRRNQDTDAGAENVVSADNARVDEDGEFARARAPMLLRTDNLRRYIDGAAPDECDALSDDLIIHEPPRQAAGGLDGPDSVPPPPEREYVSLVCLSETAVALDTEPTDDEGFCFRCMIGKQMRARNSGSTHLDSMDELIRTQYMFMSPDELTKRVQHMYNVNLRPTIECEAMRKPWRRRVIWEHIHRHSLTPDMATKYHLRVMGAVLDVMANEGIVYKGTSPGARKVDLQSLKVYASISKEHLRGLSLIADPGAPAPALGGQSSHNHKRVGR